MRSFAKIYCLLLIVCLTACGDNEAQLKRDRADHQQDLDRLKLELKKKSDSFKANNTLSADSAFRRRVRWLTDDIHSVEVQIDSIDARLMRMNDTESQEEKEEKEREAR